MTTPQTRFLAAAAVAAFTLGAHPACAQSMDYGSAEQLFNEPITTSATGTPQRATTAPADMSIITADDIKRSGATDIPTILSRVAGIDVLNWSAGDTDVGVRGYNQLYSPRLLVLINGRSVYLDDFGYTSWATLPVTLAGIRQIEVVRGPNSALFGFNAVGGVINIITYNPKYDDINALEAHGGTGSNVGGSVVQTLRLGDRISTQLSAGGERQDEWRNTAGYDAPWNAHAAAIVTAQLARATELRLEGAWARSAYAEMVADNTYNAATYTTKSIMGTISSDTPYGNIQARAYVNTLSNRNMSSRLGLIDFKNQIEVASLQDLFKIGARHTVRVALEYRNNRGNTTPIKAGRIGYSVVAPSAMWNFAATSKLSLSAAARLDHMNLRRTGPEPQGFVYSRNSDWSRTIDSVSLNLGAVYALSDFDILRATYARGVQSPTLTEYGGFQILIVPGPFPVTLGGNPHVNPAVVSNYQLSYDRILPVLKAKASAKVFFQHTDDVKGTWDVAHPVVARPPARGVEGVIENASTSNMTGFELSASGKINGGFHWNADTTYTQVKDKAIGGYNLVTRQIAFAQTTPKFRGNVAVGWNDARWSVDGYVHYVSAYGAYRNLAIPTPSPAYVTLAARVGYQVSEGLTASLSGQNLGEPDQVQGLATGLQASRRVIFSLTKSW